MSGGVGRAETGELTIMVGGPEATLNQVKPFFDIMGSTVTLIGLRNGMMDRCVRWLTRLSLGLQSKLWQRRYFSLLRQELIHIR